MSAKVYSTALLLKLKLDCVLSFARVKSEVMAVLFEGYEESIKMAGEAAGLFSEAGEPDKSQDAEITKSICEDLQEASVLANSAVKAFENARISGVKHHFQKANDEYAKASVLCNKTGNKAYADELKVLAYAAMEAYKDMEAADAEGEKGVENAEDIEKAVEDYADMLDGKPDEEEPDAGGSVEPCLTGVISRRIMAPSKVSDEGNTCNMQVGGCRAEGGGRRMEGGGLEGGG
jgi:tetratricopeptide (TPR) repeat protein